MNRFCICLLFHHSEAVQLIVRMCVVCFPSLVSSCPTAFVMNPYQLAQFSVVASHIQLACAFIQHEWETGGSHHAACAHMTYETRFLFGRLSVNASMVSFELCRLEHKHFLFLKCVIKLLTVDNKYTSYTKLIIVAIL